MAKLVAMRRIVFGVAMLAMAGCSGNTGNSAAADDAGAVVTDDCEIPTTMVNCHRETEHAGSTNGPDTPLPSTVCPAADGTVWRYRDDVAGLPHDIVMHETASALLCELHGGVVAWRPELSRVGAE